MNRLITIIMYHYVRDLSHSRFPDIKGLDKDLFRHQIEYLQKHYSIITMELLIDAIEGNVSLPSKAVLLTFDDGYADHYLNVFPILDEMKLQGSFFVPVKAIAEHKVLDVNKIHFILACEKDKSRIIEALFGELDKHREEYHLESNQCYFEKLAKASRFDTREVIFIKRLLQLELKEGLRNKIVRCLFDRFVDLDEEAFSRELYLSVDQLKCLKRHGMHIGSHGYDHYWLDSLSRRVQEREIDLGLAFLNEVGADVSNWTMCYPYGAYNQDTVDVLREKGCRLALTTGIDIADLNKHHRYALPRLDTNDIPKHRDAEVNDWFGAA